MRSTIPILFLVGCAADGHGDGKSYNCAEETRDDEFVAGLQKTGQTNTLDFQLMAAVPAPPASGDNEWTLQVNTIAGAPVSGASITVTPFMPDHQHGTPTRVVVDPLPTAGQYKLAPVNMWMPGLWETTIEVTGTGTDKVVYKFCIPS